MPNQIQKGPFLPLSETSNETAELLLEDIGELGDTLAVFEGKYINVFGGIPGEKVLCRIVRYRRRRRAIVSAIVLDVLKSSPYRISVPCQYFGSCSGCQWQHISYPHQLDLKKRILSDKFKEFDSLKGVDVLPVRPAPNEFFYRNHARFTVRFGGQLGFSNRITRRFVRIDKCLLMAPDINEALNGLQDKADETTNVSVRVGFATSDRLIQPTLLNPDIPFDTGQKWYIEKMKGRQFRVASPSFFQVNTLQAEQMIDLVGDYLQLSGREILVDAYAGVGTFAAILAPRSKRVIAIEESASAVKDGRIGTSDIGNIDYILGKSEEVLMDLNYSVDALILDPPRIGCHPDALDAVMKSQPAKIAYVSCDPSSLARDLDILVRGGYRVEVVQPVDMFPQTYHIECVVSLRFEG